MTADTRAQLAELRELLAKGEASDGYHTHRELYEYRMLYNAHAAIGWLAAGIPVVKSRKHSDGEPCFGGGWFIVTATLPTGQVSNHYRDEHWDLFNVPAVELPPEYDGHTPADASKRLAAALAAAPLVAAAPTLEQEIEAAWRKECSGNSGGRERSSYRDHFAAGYRAARAEPTPGTTPP